MAQGAEFVTGNGPGGDGVAHSELDRRNRLVASAEGVSRARRFVRSALDAVGCAPEQAEIAVLLVSEVTSNAVLHARSTPR